MAEADPQHVFELLVNATERDKEDILPTLESFPLGREGYLGLDVQERVSLAMILVHRFGDYVDGVTSKYAASLEVASPVEGAQFVAEATFDQSGSYDRDARRTPTVRYRLRSMIPGYWSGGDAVDLGSVYRDNPDEDFQVYPFISRRERPDNPLPLESPKAEILVQAMDAVNLELLKERAIPLWCKIGLTGVAGCEEA